MGEPSLVPDRLPNLDGLRTIAATLVVLAHSQQFWTVAGCSFTPVAWVQAYLFEESFPAVQFFFVLSGFLITRGILADIAGTQGFSLGKFLLRRVARIWPVYYLVVSVAALLAWKGGPLFTMWHNNWALLLCFLENFDLMRLMKANLVQGVIVSVLWSVSIEEQFYLVYPLLLMLIPRRCYGAFLALVVLGAATAKYRGMFNVFHTLSACYELSLGCLLAWLVHGRKPIDPHPSLSLLPYLMLFLPLEHPIKSVLQPILFAGIIYDQAFCDRHWLQTRFIPGLNPLGKLTYGIYSYHMIVVMLSYQLLRYWHLQGFPSFMLYLTVVLSLSIGLSWISYRWIEHPILARGR